MITSGATGSASGGGLTDAELRATPVPVSGTVTANLAAGANNIGDVDVLSTVIPANRTVTYTVTNNFAREFGTAIDTDGAELVGFEVRRTSGSGTSQPLQFQATVGSTKFIVNSIQLDGTIAASFTVAGTPVRGFVPIIGFNSLVLEEASDGSVEGSVFTIILNATSGGRQFAPGQQTMANSQPVVIASDQSTLPVSIAATVVTKELRAASSAVTAVADSASSVTLLASNANRLGASIANDSSAALYLKLGATASLTSYTARVTQYGYYEVPYGYTGIIDGIWATDPGDGAARVTEITA